MVLTFWRWAYGVKRVCGRNFSGVVRRQRSRSKCVPLSHPTIWKIVPAILLLIPALLHPCRVSTLQSPFPKRVPAAPPKRPIRTAPETEEQSQWLALVLLAPTLEPSSPHRLS